MEAPGASYKISTVELGWMLGMEEGRALQPGIMWTVLSCTEEEKAEARAFEEDQVAGRLKEDVVSLEGAG